MTPVIVVIVLSLTLLSQTADTGGACTMSTECPEGDVCVRVGGAQTCTPYAKKGERCTTEGHILGSLIPVYEDVPPCATGLTCVEKNGAMRCRKNS